MGGNFSGANSIGGQTRNYIARLDATTGAADSWNPNATNQVYGVAVQADGKVLAVGTFITIGGEARNRIARLDAAGFADSFNPNANNSVDAIAVQADEKILVGGDFNGANSIGGQTRNYIARFDATTGAADSFDPSASNLVFSIAVQPDGKILAGGFFNSIGGQTRNNIARLDAATGAADLFNPNANSAVRSVAVQADGNILAAGSFTSIGGSQRNRIARLDATTGAADSFDPSANGAVYSIALQADGKGLAGGGFTSVGGQSRFLLARLSNDTAAQQNLAVTQSAITWTRGGSSPQFARVTFESSNDNVNYTPLGNVTAGGSSWSLTGLSLPTGQNIYIRARGFYRGGQYNASESIAESVRNAFITLPPTPSAVVSRKLHNGAPFDIPLPLTGSSGVECRSGGATNDYQLVFTFPSAVSFTSASVTSGMGTVSSSSGNGTTTVTVDLTSITDAQRITVTLLGVSNGTTMGDVGVQIGMLVGDANGDGVINSADATITRNTSGQATDATNFRADYNTDGFINSADATIVRNRSGSGLPLIGAHEEPGTRSAPVLDAR
ncbi:MAG: dockerin type I domain-containing protein [Verrucomicrobiota bacterium]|nr:dockerin type I domain-containing protein [Verrucomicrobiota bacterium]